MEPELPLRDIHLPPPISWWPPAPGWWILGILLIALVYLSIWSWRRRRRNRAVRMLCLAELTAIEQTGATPTRQLQDLAILIRRACLSTYARSEVAGLSGETWLRFLDTQLGGNRFSEGIGRLLSDGPYRPTTTQDLQPLFSLCREWLESLPKPDAVRKVNTP